MSDKEFPEESKDTVYERDKTAKEPVVPAPLRRSNRSLNRARYSSPRKSNWTNRWSGASAISSSPQRSGGHVQRHPAGISKELAEKPSEEAEKEYEDWKNWKTCSPVWLKIQLLHDQNHRRKSGLDLQRHAYFRTYERVEP